MLDNAIESTPGFLKNSQYWVYDYPGFFTPYKNCEDFLYTLVSPVIAPVVFCFTACESLASSILLAIATFPLTIGAQVVGEVFNQPNWGDFVLKFMTVHATQMLIASVCFACLAIVSIVGAPIGLVTRTIASIIDGINTFFKSDDDTPNIDESTTCVFS
ncbi:hypothetical protein [Legionella bononiensis]|uniref:Integral membrane protein n=1 Tax=Legionella bononiensis TaxID=2793102 RepID=A0ABS1WAM8_9GAMM|nr:hypothetical protein [Legionella bononiensis]MBL7480375.1 hypothetical protein [Legionella bononiensis]MBL7526393.1 hypothetical protein [Legionella bononiensis]MBL7563113.1 hypothetical protein [Legionella bononiensis]